MLGNMIQMIRKEKNITKTKLSELTGINIGHLTHIEKGERNPSHRALLSICKALQIPYEALAHAYDKELSDEQKKSNYIKYISYDKVPVFTEISDFVTCPAEFINVSFAYKVPDNAMAPIFETGSTAFVESAGLLSNKEIGLFKVDDKFVIRKFLYRKNDIVLRAEDKSIEDIKVSETKDFKVIGRIYA